MFFGILELVRRGFYKKGAKIAAWHTGNAHGEACARSGRYSLENIEFWNLHYWKVVFLSFFRLFNSYVSDLQRSFR